MTQTSAGKCVFVFSWATEAYSQGPRVFVFSWATEAYSQGPRDQGMRAVRG